MSDAGESSTGAVPVEVTIAEFQKLALRVGIIREATEHPNADRLLVLKVDIGEAEPRQLVAGIRGSYELADLIGKHVVVVSNIKTAKLRGVESQGMVLAATGDSALILVCPEQSVAAGSIVK